MVVGVLLKGGGRGWFEDSRVSVVVLWPCLSG